MTASAQGVDYAAVTSRQRDVWGAGDFNVIAMTIIPVSMSLVDAADPRPGQRVLDVACGSGNTALAAARRFCRVTGVDFVPALVERARLRAAADGTAAEFREGDAQNLPFPDDSFDVVLSSFGVMFAPDQERAAAELLRVTRPGGTIALACWGPESYGGQFFKIAAKYAPPPPGLRPAARWGTEQGLRELLGAGTASMRVETLVQKMFYLSVEHAVETFKTWMGPTRRAFEQLDDASRAGLEREMTELYCRMNRATDGTLVLDYDYTQVVAKVK